MELDVVFFGHFALDKVIYQAEVTETLGGGVTFGSAAATAYDPGLRVGIVSVVGGDFKPEYRRLVDGWGVDLRGVHQTAGHTTRYVLRYHPGGRDLTLAARAPDLAIEQVPEAYYHARACMLGPICNEIRRDFVYALEAKLAPATRIGVDVQGFIRDFDAGGNVKLKDKAFAREKIYDLIDTLDHRLVLKASDYEAAAITGKANPYEAIRELNRSNAVIIVTRGEYGSLVLQGAGDLVKIPAFRPSTIRDETGAGDAYMAGFLAEFCRDPGNLHRAGLVGSAVASFLLEGKGPSGVRPKAEVERRIREASYLAARDEYNGAPPGTR